MEEILPLAFFLFMMYCLINIFKKKPQQKNLSASSSENAPSKNAPPVKFPPEKAKAELSEGDSSYSYRKEFSGSIHEPTFEGMDLCDDDLGHSDTHSVISDLPNIEEEQYNLSSQLIQGIIWSQILDRPRSARR